MVDFVATIKVQFEALGLTDGGAEGSRGGGGTGGTGSGSAGGGGSVFSSLRELQEEFRKLSAQVRAVSAGLEQIGGAARGVSGAGTGSDRPERPSAGATPEGAEGVEQFVDALNTAGKVASEAAEQSRRQASAQEETSQRSREATEASEREARASSEAASAQEVLNQLHEQAAKDAKRAAGAQEQASKADEARLRALRQLSNQQPDIQLDPAKLFRSFRDIADNPEFRRVSNSLQNAAEELITLPKGVDQRARDAADSLRKSINNIISQATQEIAAGRGGSRQLSEVGRSIRRARDEAFGELQQGQRPSVDVGEIERRLSAREFTTRADQLGNIFDNIAKKIEEGADAIEVSTLQQRFGEVTETLREFTSRRQGRIFGGGRGGREPFPGAADLGRQAASVVPPRRPPGIELDRTQTRALRGLQESIRGMVQPTEAVQRVVSELVQGGRGLDNIEERLRTLLDNLKTLDRQDFPDDADFLRFQEAVRTLGRVKFDERRGLTGPAGTVSQEDAVVAGRRQVQELRQRLSSEGRGARGGLNLQLPDAEGNVRQVRVELEALGDTLDSVRVKAKNTSDNMFDRTSVRAALQRVATWGAAAGIVFGAVDAFRRALDTVIETEAAIIGLAKVMDQSTADFEGFANAARSAATAIAQEFGQPLNDVLETMTLFGQQGLNLTEAIERTRAASVAANVTTLDQTRAASALTAAIKQFGLESSEAISVVNKFNEVSNNAAVTEVVLADSLSKAGQAARNAGVSLDDFNGIVAAISEQTRQSGREIGTALRFIFSRLQTQEAEQGLAQIGVSARDAQGDLRGFVPIVSEIADKFQDLSEAQKTQVAISISGTRRFNILLALLDNFSRFQESAANSANSAGSALEEQEKVAQTTAFRLEQLKNSLRELALSFGDTFNEPLKATIDALGSFVDILSAIPGPLKTVLGLTALGGVGFARFTEQITDFFGLAGAVSGAGGAVGGALRRNLTRGVPRNIQQRQAGEDFVQLTGATVIGREVADFVSPVSKAEDATDSLTSALKRNNAQLVDSRGRVLKNSRAFGKFGATIRGLRVRETVGGAVQDTALSLAALNSGITRLFAFLGRGLNRVTSIIPLVGRSFDALDRGIARTSGRMASFLGTVSTLGRLLAGGLAIGGVIILFNKLREAVTTTGQDIAESLEAEIAEREQNIANLNKELQAVNNLREAREDLLRLSSEGTTPGRTSVAVSEEIFRGRFTSPTLERQRLREQEAETSQTVGLADPQLIETIDDLGNVTLRSADAFQTLADSAQTAQERLLALTRIKAVEALSSELGPAEGARGFFGGLVQSIGELTGIESFQDFAKTAGDELQESISELRNQLGRSNVQFAQEFGISLNQLSDSAAQKLRSAGGDVQAALAQTQAITQSITEQIRQLPEDVGEATFRQLIQEGSEFRENVLETQARALQAQGRDVGPRNLANQLFLQNRSQLEAVRENIGATAEESLGRFREAGLLEELLDEQGQQLSGGEIILFENVEGFSRQGIVELTENGRRVIKTVSEDLSGFATQSLNEFLSEASGDVVFIDPDRAREQFNRVRTELGRIISGAGRGGLLRQDIDLGAAFDFELSAQQRVGLNDETLISDLRKSQEQIEKFVEGIGIKTTQLDELTEEAIDPEVVSQFKELAEQFDALATITRYKAAIEEVNIEFERAVDEIRRLNIKETILAEFTGQPGSFDLSGGGLPSQRSVEETVARDLGGFVALANSVERLQQALAEGTAGQLNAARDIQQFSQDLRSASEAGAIRDDDRLSVIATRAARLGQEGLSRAQAEQLVIAGESLDQQERTNELLTELIAEVGENPRLLGQALSTAVQNATAGEGSLGGELLDRLGDVTPEQARGFTTQDIRAILQRVSGEQASVLSQEFRRRQGLQGAQSLANQLVTAAGRKFDLEEDASGSGGAGGRPSVIGSIIAETQSRIFAQSFSDALSSPGVRRFLETGEPEAIPEETVTRLAEGFASALETGARGEQAEGRAEELRRLIEEDRDQLREAVVESIRQVQVGLPGEDVPEPEGTGPSASQSRQRAKREEVQERERARDTAETLKDINDAYVSSIRRTLNALNDFTTQVRTLGKDLTTSLQQSIDQISVDRQLRRFNAPLFGALEGTATPNREIDRRRFGQLDPLERVAVQQQDLVRGFNEADAAFQGLREQLVRIREEEAAIRRARQNFAAEGNIEAVGQADQALQQLGSVANLVEGQLSTARDSLQQFGQSIGNIEAVEQLRVKIEDLVSSFEREQALRFDRTSIQTALGRTPFSFTRPSFEQFEQGQGGSLTRFERAIESLEFRQRQGEITPQEAQTERRRAEFERDEAIIEFAQQRETRALQSQVQTAEQIRSTLFDFVQSGGPGAQQARGLFNTLTRQLERAGDITRGDFGAETVRDPRTGNQVRIPASEIRQFRGVPGIDEAVRQAAQISRQVQAQQQQQQADLITQPLLEVLDQVPGKLDEIVASLKEQTGIEDPEAENEFVQSAGELATVVSDLQKLISQQPETPEEQRQATVALVEIANKLERFDADALTKALNNLAGAQGEGGEPISALAALKEAARNVGDPDAIKQVNEVLEKVGTLPIPTEEFQVLQNNTSNLAARFLEFVAEITSTFPFLSGFSDSLDSLATKINNIDLSPQTGGGQAQELAAGGLVTGPGGPKSDSVPIRASSGEFVLNARAVKSIGVDQLNKMNQSGNLIGPDSSIKGDPLIGLQEGGSIADKIKELQKRRKELIRKVESDESLTAAEEEEKKEIENQLKNLKVRRATLVTERIAREQKLKAQGIRGSSGTSLPDDASLDDPKVVEALAEERQRRIEQKRKGADLGKLSQFSPGEVFARRNEEGRLEFTNIGGRGAVDTSRFTGVSATDPDSIFREAERRKEFNERIESARKARKEEVKKEAAELAEGEGRRERNENASAAIAELRRELAKKTQKRVSSLQESLSKLKSLEDTARQGLAGEDGILTVPDPELGPGAVKDITVPGAREFTGGDFRLLKENLEDVEAEIKNKFKRLDRTTNVPLTVEPPPDFETTFAGTNIRTEPGSSTYGLNYNSLTGEFDPQAFGNVFLTNPEIEAVLEGIRTGSKPGLRISQLERSIKKFESPSGFADRTAVGGFLSETGRLAEAYHKESLRDAAAKYGTDSDEYKRIRSAIEGNLTVSNLVTQTPVALGGGLADVSAQFGEDPSGALKDLALDPVRAGNELRKASLGNTLGIGEKTEARKRVEAIKEDLSKAQDPEERRRLRDELLDAEVSENASNVLTGAAVVGTVVPAVGFARRGLRKAPPLGKGLSPRSRAEAVESLNQQLDNPLLDDRARRGIRQERDALQGQINRDQANLAEEAARKEKAEAKLKTRLEKQGTRESLPIGEDQPLRGGTSRRAAQAEAIRKRLRRVGEQARIRARKKRRSREEEIGAGPSRRSRREERKLEERARKLEEESAVRRAQANTAETISKNVNEGVALRDAFDRPVRREGGGDGAEAAAASPIESPSLSRRIFGRGGATRRVLEGLGGGIGLGGAGLSTFGVSSLTGGLALGGLGLGAGILPFTRLLGLGGRALGRGTRRLFGGISGPLSSFASGFGSAPSVFRQLLPERTGPGFIERFPETGPGKFGQGAVSRVGQFLSDLFGEGPEVSRLRGVLEGGGGEPPTSVDLQRAVRSGNFDALLETRTRTRTDSTRPARSEVIERPNFIVKGDRTPLNEVLKARTGLDDPLRALENAGTPIRRSSIEQFSRLRREGTPESIEAANQIIRGLEPDIRRVVEGRDPFVQQRVGEVASRVSGRAGIPETIAGTEFDPHLTLRAHVTDNTLEKLLRESEAEGAIREAEIIRQVLRERGIVEQPAVSVAGEISPPSPRGGTAAETPESLARERAESLRDTGAETPEALRNRREPNLADTGIPGELESRLGNIARGFGLEEDFFSRGSTLEALRSLGAENPAIALERLASGGQGAAQAIEEVIAASRGQLGPLVESRAEGLARRAVGAADPEAVRAAREAIEGLGGREALSGVELDDLLRSFDLDPDDVFASGGQVKGPGGPKSDRVPILASNGEFVLNADAVSKLGLPAVELMNRTGKLPGFQDGGLIDEEETPFGALGFKGDTASRRSGSDGGATVLDDEGKIFDTISGRGEGAVNVSAALKQLSAGKSVFVNRRTGEEVIASPVLAEELRRRGFSERVDPDLQVLNAVSQGAELFENPRTGEIVAASGLNVEQLRRQGFKPTDKPLSEVLEKDIIVGPEGGLSLVKRRGDISGRGRQSPFDRSLARLPAEQQNDPQARRQALTEAEREARKERFSLQRRFEEFAGGGAIRGSGGPRSDQVPILASNGEFVINSEAVDRLGLSTLNALNQGGSLSDLPRFQEGGLVGPSNGGGDDTSITVDTEAISQAITEAIREAVQEVSIDLSVDDAATTITNAISSAFENIDLPELQVDTENVSVSVDVPEGGVPIDATALQNLDLGQALGADVRNRLEAVEGSVSSVREDTNDILDSVSDINFDVLSEAAEDIATIRTRTETLSSDFSDLRNTVSTQEDRVLDQVEFRINEEFSADNTENDVNARMDREFATVRQDVSRLQNRLGEAIRVANQALTKALARV